MPTQTPASAPRGTQKVSRSAVAAPARKPTTKQKKSASSPRRRPKKPNIFVRFLHGLVRRLYFGSKTLFKFALFIPILVFMVWFSYTVDRSGLFQGELAPRRIVDLMLQGYDVSNFEQMNEIEREVVQLFAQDVPDTPEVIGIGSSRVLQFTRELVGTDSFFNMGVTGAAVATVIGQFCGCILALIFNLKKNEEIHLQFRGFRPNWRLVGNIYAIGLPSVIMVAIGSVMTFCMNKILIAYHSAKETAATAFGIYFKLNSFIFMPVFGLNNGVVPIVAYNYGAQNRLRMVETIKRSTIYASCIMVLGVIIFWAIPGPLLKIFDATDTMLQVGVPALRIISLSFCMAGACIALGSSFQALGKAVYSMTTSIIRQLVFLVPIAYVLARYGYSIGNDDLVWWSYPLAEIASLLVTLVFFRRLYRTLIAPLPANGGAPVHDDSDDDPIGE